jgi:flagellar M-ring protein FliF
MAEVTESSNLPDLRTGNVERINIPGADFLRGAAGMPAVRQLALLIAIAASVAIGVVAVLWMQSPDYRPLSGINSVAQANEVAGLLDSNGIPHRIDERTGVILVPQDHFHSARMMLAGAGQLDESPAGYELLDGDQGFGVSQFMELTRHRRSVEGELARSIGSLDAVQSARVLLATPKATTFLRDRRKPSASVTVRLFPGHALTDPQIRGITSLVAAAVPELEPEAVAVVDQSGKLLSLGEEDQDLEASERQLAYIAKVERQLQNKVSGLLRPLVGADGFGVEVSADVDFTRSEQAEELYNPEQAAIRSEARLEEKNYEEPVAAGVPGALSNQPPETERNEDLVLATGASNAVSSRTESTRNFEIDRTVAYTQRAVGSIKRLTVSVVVDDIAVVDPETGEAKVTPWSEEDLQQLTESVKNAVGFSEQRGDLVSVVNRRFFTPAVEPVAEVPFWAESWFVELLKQSLVGVLLLLLALGFLRPLFRNLSKAGAAVQERNTQAQAQLGQMSMEGVPIDPNRPAAGMLLPAGVGGYEAKVDAVRGLVAQDPGRVAQVVKHWVSKDE